MLLLWLFATLFMLFGSVISNSDPSKICPDKELISPCTCKKDCEKCEAHIECSRLLNMDQLISVFSKSKEYTFWNFHIVNSTFIYIPSVAFSEKRVRKLFLGENVMLSLFDKPPPKSNDLKKIEMYDLTIKRGVKWEWFSSFPNLEEFNLIRYELKKIDQAFINNFPRNLIDLRLMDTKTKKLADNVFAKLNKLVSLVVKNTKIKVLKRSMFPTPSSLFAIDISGNLISSLPNDVFSNMPELQAIELSHTQIKTVSESVFGAVIPQLEVLSMEGNHIECNCGVKWITQLPKLPMYLDMVCAKPKPVAGKAVKDLKPAYFEHCE